MMINEHEIRIYASHHQFFIQDGQRPPWYENPDHAAFWSAEAMDRRLAIGEGVLAVGTGTYGFVKVRVEHHDAEPAVDLDDWDHISEADLAVNTGLILILDIIARCGLFFDMEPANYRVRLCHANLAESEQEASGCSGEFHDWYLVQFWRSSSAGPRILKRRPRRA